MGEDRKNSKVDSSTSRMWNLASLGTEFAVIVLGAITVGNWADSKWDVAPWGILSSLVFAMVFGIYYLIHRTKNA